jgi:hypothetical protein
MIKYYLAGPMTGLPNFNYDAFRDMERKVLSVMDCGIEILNPITIADGDTTKPYEFYIRESIEMILRANAVVFLEGWQNSTGAQLGYNIAKLLKLELYDHNLEKME